MKTPEDIRETVRQRYAAAATRLAVLDLQQEGAPDASCCGGGCAATTDEQDRASDASCCGGGSTATTDERAATSQASCCGSAPVGTTDEEGQVVFGPELYGLDAAEGAPVAALEASLGCGVPTAVADLHPGEVVLDLGSGAGADVLISAREVALAGRAIGLDMTAEMLGLARRNAAEAGVDNVEFVQGYLEDIPLFDDSVDVVISNCVINLTADKSVSLPTRASYLRRLPGFCVGVAGWRSPTSSRTRTWTRPRRPTWRSGPGASPAP